MLIIVFTVCIFCIRLSGKKLPEKISVKIGLLGFKIEFDIYFTRQTDDEKRGPPTIAGDDPPRSEVEDNPKSRRRWFRWRRRGK